MAVAMGAQVMSAGNLGIPHGGHMPMDIPSGVEMDFDDEQTQTQTRARSHAKVLSLGVSNSNSNKRKKSNSNVSFSSKVRKPAGFDVPNTIAECDEPMSDSP